MENKNEVSYLKNTRCADVYTESQTDYILPDYMGDMRKILFTDATLRPSGRFAGGDEVEFSGVVVYNLIYLDSEGELSSVEFSSDYDYSVKCSGESYSDSIADTRVANYAVRLVGPRKISAKASLVGSVCLCESCSISVSGDAFDGESSPEVNTGSLSLRRSVVSSVSEREYAECVARLEGAIADEVRVIYPNVEVMVDELHSEDDAVSVKGRLRMSALIKNGEEPVRVAEKLVSFDERLDFEGVGRLDSLLPKLSVCSVKATVNADESGCEVVMSGIVELCVVGEGNQAVDILLDGYLKDAPTEARFDEMKYSTLADVVRFKETHTTEIGCSELELEGIGELVFLNSIPKIERVECDGNAVTIEGEVRYSGVAGETIGDKNSYTSVRFSAPFRLKTDVKCQNPDNLRIEAELRSLNTTATLESDRIFATATLECSVVALEDSSISLLSSLSRREGESYEAGGSVVTVYYPTDGDTLFSVAKQYHTSSLKLAKDNDITDAVFSADNKNGSLLGIKKLIIF